MRAGAKVTRLSRADIGTPMALHRTTAILRTSGTTVEGSPDPAAGEVSGTPPPHRVGPASVPGAPGIEPFPGEFPVPRPPHPSPGRVPDRAPVTRPGPGGPVPHVVRIAGYPASVRNHLAPLLDAARGQRVLADLVFAVQLRG